MIHVYTNFVKNLDSLHPSRCLLCAGFFHRLFFSPEGGGDKLLWYVGWLSADYISIISQWTELFISHIFGLSLTHADQFIGLFIICLISWRGIQPWKFCWYPSLQRSCILLGIFPRHTETWSCHPPLCWFQACLCRTKASLLCLILRHQPLLFSGYICPYPVSLFSVFPACLLLFLLLEFLLCFFLLVTRLT